MPNLTAEQLLRLQQIANPTSGSGWTPESGLGYFRDGDTVYQTGSDGSNFSYDYNNVKPGDEFSVYGSDGQFSNTGQFKDMGPDGLLAGMLSDPAFYAFLASAGAAGFGLPGMGAESAGAGAGISGPGISTVNGMTTFGVVDPAVQWGAGALGGASGGAAGAAAAGGGGGSGSLGTMAPMQPMSTAGLGSPLTPIAVGSGVGSLLGPAATALGALSGAQGQDNSQSQEKKMPPWLEEMYRNPQTGLLPMSLGLLQEQMPLTKQNAGLLNSMGSGLVNTPQAGNGYLRLMGRN